MSTDILESRVTKLNSLCKHYVIVLSKKRAEADRISQALIDSRHKTSTDEKFRNDEFKIAVARFMALQAGFSRLRPALEKLVRTVSQTVEHSARDDVDGLELTILLAELESNLQQTQMLIGQLPQFATQMR